MLADLGCRQRVPNSRRRSPVHNGAQIASRTRALLHISGSSRHVLSHLSHAVRAKGCIALYYLWNADVGKVIKICLSQGPDQIAASIMDARYSGWAEMQASMRLAKSLLHRMLFQCIRISEATSTPSKTFKLVRSLLEHAR